MGISMSNIKEMGELESEVYEAYCEEVKRLEEYYDGNPPFSNGSWFSNFEASSWNQEFDLAKKLDGLKDYCTEDFLREILNTWRFHGEVSLEDFNQKWEFNLED